MKTQPLFKFFNKRRFFLPGLLILLFSCASPRAIQQPGESDERAQFSLAHQIDQILQDSLLNPSQIGIKIVSLENDDVLYARNSEKLFNPASNMKLLTTAAALRHLGPDFRFRTILLADTGEIRDSTIFGNLYLKGFGNPDLTTTDLQELVLKLKWQGVRQIRGGLICDDSYFDDLYWGTGWMWDDASSWYFAPINALSVNDNCVAVTVMPGDSVGDSLRVRLFPSTSYMKIENRGITVDSTDTLALDQFNVERKWKVPENTVVIEGGLAVGATERVYFVDVVDAALYTGTLFKELLEAENIIVEGEVQRDTLPNVSLVLAEHVSAPLSQVIFNTNKISDNLSAEQILKTLGAEVKGIPGTARKGISVIKNLFQELGIDSTSYRIVDGSGVSRYNLVTPDMIIELLCAMYRDFRSQAEYMVSLPIAGIDGTLKKRMNDTRAQGYLRAKTGSLSGVSALAGYTVTADKEVVAFSIIIEHFVASPSKIRNIQDRICELIAVFSRHPVASN